MMLPATQCAAPPPSLRRFFVLLGGVEPPTKFSKRGGLTGSQFLEGGCWERVDELFHGAGGAVLHKK